MDDKITKTLTLFGKNIDISMDSEKCVDSQLWHACAGSVVKMPAENSLVYYFPQGHLENAQSHLGNIEIMNPLPPLLVLSRVESLKFMADPYTDEVFAKIRLVPINQNPSFDHPMEEDTDSSLNVLKRHLSESDTKNGGGFSVPKQSALAIFPNLNYEDNPPVQYISCKDVHGKIWSFRHIYRGLPKRHLLNGSWSDFVNKKKLSAGDSIVFLKKDSGDIHVGIRRKKSRAEPSSAMNMISKESVVEAMRQASSGHTFEVVYYPGAGTPEFCVDAKLVRKAARIAWCPGMRFKMPLESTDRSRINWRMGIISGVEGEQQSQWPKSPWRQLEVRWVNTVSLQDVERVNPWLVEIVPNMLLPLMDQAFSPPTNKKLCLRPPPTYDFLSSMSRTIYTGHQFPSPLQFHYSTVSGIQGSRQNGYFSGVAAIDRRRPAGFHLSDNDVAEGERALTLKVGVDHAVVTDAAANKASDAEKKTTSTPTTFMLFGQIIVIPAEKEQTPDPTSFRTVKSSSGVNHGSVLLDDGGGDDDDDAALPRTINFF